MNNRLLDTKFYPPPTRSIWIKRPRLIDKLEYGMTCRALLLSAPAGFGKTTLLSEWLQQHSSDRRYTWLSLESGDDDPQRFFRYFVAAWQRLYPAVGVGALDEQNSNPSLPLENLAIILLNDLLLEQEQSDRYSIFVLDDYHVIQTKEIHAFLAYIIEHMPPRCQIILATRSDPPLPIARWRSRGYLYEVRANDLRFISSEVDDYFKQSGRLYLSDDQVRVLEEKTEGWVVGMQMAALSLHGHKDPQKFVSAFGGSHRYILDYLLEEVVTGQPTDVQQFLLETAVLDHLSGSLCDAALDRPDGSQQMLERLERDNLFIVPLDNERCWFRYHHLFSELLRVRLRQRSPERIPGIYKRAAEWYANNRQWHAAIEYAFRSGDIDQAVRLFEKAILEDRTNFVFDNIGTLVELFPEDLVQSRPLFGLAEAMRRVDRSQLWNIFSLLHNVELQISSSREYEGRAGILGIVYAVQSVAGILLGDVDWVLSSAQKAAALLAENDRATVIVQIQLGFAHYYVGDLHQADDIERKVMQITQQNNNTYTYLAILDGLGRIRCHKGELSSAASLLNQGLEISAGYGNRYPRWSGVFQRDYAEVLREQNHLDEALQMANDGLELCQKFETISGQGLAYIHLGRIRFARKDFAGALEMLHKAEGLNQAHTLYFDLRVIIQIFSALLDLAQDRSSEAWQKLNTCEAELHPAHNLLREWVCIARARVLLYQRRPKEALLLLEGKAEAAQAGGRGRNRLDILILTALAHQMDSRLMEACNTLAICLAIAQPEGYARIFVDEGESMRDLLNEGFARRLWGGCSSYARLLLDMFEKTPALSSQNMSVEQLSERELEVLQLICAGLSNQEIAARLYLTIGTVKSHAHHIFGKLGVENRPQVIVLARQLGLVKDL